MPRRPDVSSVLSIILAANRTLLCFSSSFAWLFNDIFRKFCPIVVFSEEVHFPFKLTNQFYFD
ncbi:hypothetical protein AAJ76_3000112995 [Vairimorpha ceranae]|uniref:Uncharacterized protein n=1 Tax=Vairimorpha ceranae TaxID=40302 RepID=A0A0F9WUM7_9MICR|nr:hypothetical protein AAJ76_3000112995 [Vairimorpha ceranae]KKO76453.1 hypothetical protein AAJ76_3000112995 [Vairimorpha ceranae]